jgi:hypothetical protein
MDKETAIYWTGAENDEAVTRSRLKEYLRVDPLHRHPITGQLGAPRLYFIKKTKNYPNGCDFAIKEIRAQKRVELGTSSDGRKMYSEERDPKVVDHAYDMVKYFVVGRPSLGAADTLPEAPVGQMRVDDYERLAKERGSARRRDQRRQGVEGSY